MRRSPSSTTLLLLLLLLALALVARSRLFPPGAQGDAVGSNCPDPSSALCDTVRIEAPAPSPAPLTTILSAATSCADAGYLCAEVERTGSLRLLRWPRETPLLRVWVPEPAHLPPGVGRELQQAAVRGIQAWSGHPFPLSIRTRAQGEPADITVQWVPTLGENRIGRARLEWAREGNEVRLTVLGLDLATQIPFDPTRTLAPHELQLVAAHEMGHALGLPHSDDPRDVMYPQNTATSLTARDYRTMEALYRLPNGAEIRR